MRCVYCRPEPGTGPDPADELSADELRLMVECAAAEGVRKLRITGGEPLQRDDLERIVAAVSSVRGIREVGLTTNGLGLEDRAAALAEAGVERVNVSLDSLRRARFAQVTGMDAHGTVLRGIARAVRTFPAVKVNLVLLRGRNDDEIPDFVRFAAASGVVVRFIEYYGVRGGPEGLEGVPADEVLERVRFAFGDVERLEGDPLSVEELYCVPGAEGAVVGVVRSASTPPCRDCSKLRLTAGGELLPCLFAERGVAVKALLERGDRDAVREAVREVYGAKERSGPGGRRVWCVCDIGG
jgi:cyclic pyranopterin phosphate synthase